MEIKQSPDEAPNYNKNGEGFKSANLIKAIIVRNGTVSGSDTIDLQFEDETGQKFVAMITGSLVQMVARATNIHER